MMKIDPQANLLQQQIKSFGSHTLTMGILLVLLGTVGVIVPGLMSYATVGMFAGLLLFGGALWAYHTWQSNPGSFMDWLKPLLLLVTGVLMLIFPQPTIASLTLLLSAYLLMDAYSSFGLAHSRYPEKGWGWMVFNGIMDIALAVLFFVGWPQTSLLLLGLFVGISLVFDGWALIVIGWAMRKSGDAGSK